MVDHTQLHHVLGHDPFKRACHAVAHIHRGTAANFDFDVVGKNYFCSTLATPAGQIVALCNCVYPYGAFANSGAGGAGEEPVFTTASSLRASFAAHAGFECLASHWLESAVDRAVLRDLASVEMRQIGHWKPRRIGGIIFNRWD